MEPFKIGLRELAELNEDQQTFQNVSRLRAGGGVSWLLKALLTDRDKGIATREVARRKEAFGSNRLPEQEAESWLSIFMGSFNDATLIVLIVSAVVSLAIGLYEDPKKGWVEGVAILTAVLAVATVTASNDYSKEQQFRALNAVKEDILIKVRRDGYVKAVSVHDVVVGDIVIVEAGDKVAADGVLLEYYDVTANESSLTGEAEEITKNEDDPFLLSGCQVTNGNGQMLALAVGKESRWGRIREKLEAETKDTPLQEKLDDMANFIGYMGMGAALLTFIAIMGCWYIQPMSSVDRLPLHDVILQAFIMAVTIVVVAVPEGLPLAVTISLAYSTKKMLRDQNLIRHLAACETMGNATAICSDKTGTLTENRMAVTKCYMADLGALDCPPPSLPPGLTRLLAQGIALNTTANLDKGLRHTDEDEGEGEGEDELKDEKEDEKEAGDKGKNGRSLSSSSSALPPSPKKRLIQVLGNKTEGALLLMADKYGVDYDKIREQHRGSIQYNPFSSKRKKMSVLVPEGGDKKHRMLYVKGAAEMVLASCTHICRALDGESVPIDAAKRKELESYITTLAKQSLRTISLAHRKIEAPASSNARSSGGGGNLDLDELEEKLTLDAIVGITDPLRPEVTDAVRACQKAGIMVRMVTGDNVETAKAIARQSGILTSYGTVLEGPAFRALTPRQLDALLPSLQVLARSSPDDKHTLVARLNGTLPETQAEWEEAHPGRSWETERDKLLPGYLAEWAASRGGVGEVVGVTGDGTNDAPALRVADVGLSMGLSGTEVAKEASDIVIMDDNFASIVKAVLWGRSVFDNIRKFLQFQLTVNVVALTITFLSAVSGYDPPLNAVMMLWVNLIMDTMGALALGTEAPAPELLVRRPYKRNASLISRPMWRNILVQSAYQIAILVLLLLRANEVLAFEGWWVHQPGATPPAPIEMGSTRHMTLIFNAFVFCQIFNEFNARSLADDVNIFRGLEKNPVFVCVIFFTVVVQWLVVQYGGDFTKTEPLSAEEWRATVLLGLCAIPLGVAMRFLPVTEDPENFGGTAESGFENVEPAVDNKNLPAHALPPYLVHHHGARRRVLWRWVGVLLQLAALFVVPVLVGICMKNPERCQSLGWLDFYKF